MEEGKHIKRPNLFDKVITVRLSDVLVTRHCDRLHALSHDADSWLLLNLKLKKKKITLKR